jgi:hypothetical protein
MLKNFSISVLLLIFCFSCVKLPKTTEKETTEINKILELYDNWELEQAQGLLENISAKSGVDKGRLSILIEERKKNKKELELLLLDLKEALYNRDYEKIKGYVSESMINMIKLEKVKEVDLTGTDIYFSKIKYYKNSANTVMLINFYEDTSYIDLQFQLKNGLWKLASFGERR